MVDAPDSRESDHAAAGAVERRACGVAAMLALARRFAGTRPARTLRFVAFSQRRAALLLVRRHGKRPLRQEIRQDGDRVVAMLSIESVGFYSDSPASQKYPAGLGLLCPSTVDFVAFVGNTWFRSLVLVWQQGAVALTVCRARSAHARGRMTSAFRYGRSASGTTTLPSFC